MNSTAIYIIVTALTANLIRILPPLFIRGQIKSRFLRSFLYYIPYVTLAIMTFPAITQATESPLPGLLALVTGIIAAWRGLGLFPVSVICCIVVFLCEWFVS
ncbi:MAG: AzlD domain-containing protein [Prevotellaceae bacterium]|mgnify:CR=1 FL=1|nr:AzlD domain-containing protein [Candidatus Colivivens caballi]